MRWPWYLKPGYAVSPPEAARRLADDAARVVARRLPRRVKNWVVIHSALEVNPNGPATLQVTTEQLLANLDA